jgi:hypothetical protein
LASARSGGILAALAGVRLAADAVHRDGERLVRFLADRAVRHRAGGEALDDRLDRLDLVERTRAPRLEAEQPAQRAELRLWSFDERVYSLKIEYCRCASRAAA